MSKGFIKHRFGTIGYISPGELLPAESRSFGSGLLLFIDNICLFVGVKTVPAVVAQIGFHGIFWFHAVTLATFILILYFIMPETRGLSLEEIEALFLDS